MEKVPYDEFKKATKLGRQDDPIADAAQRMEVGDVIKFSKKSWDERYYSPRLNFWVFGWNIGFKFEVRQDEHDNYLVARIR